MIHKSAYTGIWYNWTLKIVNSTYFQSAGLLLSFYNVFIKQISYFLHKYSLGIAYWSYIFNALSSY